MQHTALTSVTGKLSVMRYLALREAMVSFVGCLHVVIPSETGPAVRGGIHVSLCAFSWLCEGAHLLVLVSVRMYICMRLPLDL